MSDAPTPPSSWNAPASGGALAEYLLDAWQRTILTWDVLRERGELNARQRARLQRLNGIFGLGAAPPSNGARPS